MTPVSVTIFGYGDPQRRDLIFRRPIIAKPLCMAFEATFSLSKPRHRETIGIGSNLPISIEFVLIRTWQTISQCTAVSNVSRPQFFHCY